jgi:hypothetical protein
MRPDGKRYDHQRRLKGAVLRLAWRRLARAPLQDAADFDALHRLVDERIGQLHGIGSLSVYDTALRIGGKLGLKPQRVYLHAGTRRGARALGLDWRLPDLPRELFPSPLQELEPQEIEDCLCIFKDSL